MTPTRTTALLAAALLPAAAAPPAPPAAPALGGPPALSPAASARPSPAARGARRPPPADTVAALVERARSEAAAGRHGEAARLFCASADLAPAAGRWLRLSALQHAARAGDASVAGRLADALRGDAVVPADSVRVEEARAAFEAGDEGRGRELAAALDGDEDPDLWVRHVGPALLAAGDTGRARRGYLAAATAPEAPAEAGRRLARLGAGWEELAAVARADLREGRDARGRSLLARALDAAPPEAAPGLALRLVEARLEAGLEARAHRTAGTWLEREGLDGETRARLELLAARSHFRRGQRAAGETHLRRATRAGGGDRSARAAYLLASHAHDRGARQTARERYREAAERFPAERLGGQARMRLGFMELADGRPASAAGQFRTYRRRRPGGSWGHAALYWEGRARLAAGDTSRGRELLERAARRDPVSYYGQMAAHRIGDDPLTAILEDGEDGEGEAVTGRPPPPPADERPAGSAPGAGRPPASERSGSDGAGTAAAGRSAGFLDALLGRMDAVRRLGWERRALRELDALRGEALDAAGGPLELAGRLHGAGWPDQGIGLGWAAFDRRGGRWTRPLLEAVFPLPHREALTAAAARNGVPPVLVAAVIRQESAFDPRAVSRAGAVGLMQLMPGTAAQLARASRRPAPDEEALTNPELSMMLGARYLAGLLERFDGSWPAALIAYNAGPHRYLRWSSYPEFGKGRGLLVERIPFGETRRYVKAVLRNAYLYRRLYDLSGRPAAAE